jgi:hypothetical protein
MFESLDKHAFYATEVISSATPVQDVLQDTVQGTLQDTASECSEVQGYSIDQIMTICSVARRTAFKYAAEVVQTWFWLPEYEFRVNGVYSELALRELKRRKALGTLDNYRDVIHRENAEAIASCEVSQLSQQQPTEPTAKTSTLARFVEPDTSPFSGLSISTKATDKREVLQAELVETEAEVDADFEAFMSLSTELVTQDEAAEEADELEFQLLRKRNAAKWLKRKAILEADKQQILQGDIRPKQTGNAAAAVS